MATLAPVTLFTNTNVTIGIPLFALFTLVSTGEFMFNRVYLSLLPPAHPSSMAQAMAMASNSLKLFSKTTPQFLRRLCVKKFNNDVTYSTSMIRRRISDDVRHYCPR